jgi:hypothetical protein
MRAKIHPTSIVAGYRLAMAMREVSSSGKEHTLQQLLAVAEAASGTLDSK